MGEEKITSNDIVQYVSAQILSGPEDSIFDDIFDWIANAISSITRGVTSFIDSAVARIRDAISSIVGNLLSPLRAAIDWIKLKAGSIWDWIVDIYYKVSDWASSAWNIITSACSSVINRVQGWITDAASFTWSWITTEVGKVQGWLATTATNLASQLWAWLQEGWANITGLFSTWAANIANWFTNLNLSISSYFTDLWLKIEAGWEWLKIWMTENIVAPMGTWWDSFLGKVFDFGAWVGKLLDAIESWVSADVPGHSIRWKGWLDTFWGWFFGHGLKWGEWPIDYFWEDLAGLIKKLTAPIGNMLGAICELFDNAVIGLAEKIGPMSPDIVMANYSSIAKVGIAALGGLAGLTLAGEATKFWSHAGLGHLSAIFYDMSNYKLVTGALMGALTVAMLRTPLTYHFNSLFRPWLLDRRSFMDLLSRRAFTNPEALQNPDLTTSIMTLTGGDGKAYVDRMIGYYGNPPIYYGLFKELANTPLRYFPLAGIARTGYFEKVWFTEALHRSGYSETAVRALMVMYEKEANESVRGMMSGAAVTRFKEGFVTEEQFESEMALLGYSELQFKTYLAAAKMDYATDYIRDLITAYRDAVRKGNLSLDEYRVALLDLGMVPERVGGYVLCERARIKPREALTPIAPPTSTYETDAGKIMVDTIRRQRRKLLISRDEELATLIGLGMEPGYAKAIADNDNVRLAEKGGEES